jgi:hypothetical protein
LSCHADKKDKDKDKDGKREKKKYETVDPALLLACVYYDQNHCGYLQDRDLEDIIFSLGLDLSRAQVNTQALLNVGVVWVGGNDWLSNCKHGCVDWSVMCGGR